MSTIANWAYTNALTLWRIEDPDIYGQVGYSRAYTVLCAFEQVSAIRPEGSIPSAEVSAGEDTYYFELAPGTEEPKPGWVVALGDIAGDTPPSSGKRIRSLTKFDVAMFGEPNPDYKVTVA